MNAGQQLASYLDELFAKLQRPLVVVETGCLRRDDPAEEINDGWSTLYFAQWVTIHKGSKFFSSDIDSDHIQIAGRKLASMGIRPEFPVFTLGESVDFLTCFGGDIDFAYLDTSDGWEHGLAEFQAAEAKNATMIVMDDYVSKVVKAAEYARSSGRWDVKQEGRFTVMRHV